MTLARRFEELRAWQVARELTIGVYALTRGERFSRDFGLCDQIRRAAVSTMNNIAEGFDSASRGELARFLRYASRSACEVQSCLHVALDQRYVSHEQFQPMYARAASVRKLCAALIRSLLTGGSGTDTPQVREPSAPPYGRCQAGGSPLRASTPPPVTGHRSPVTPLGRQG